VANTSGAACKQRSCATRHTNPPRTKGGESERDEMADAEAASGATPVAPAEVPAPAGDAAAPDRLAEVENALSVLQREAGLTEDTLKVLRKAVSDNLAVPRPGEAAEDSQGGSRKRPFKPSSSKRQQLTAEEAAEVRRSLGAAARCPPALPRALPEHLPWRASPPCCARGARRPPED
jgi:hypothetical protein